MPVGWGAVGNVGLSGTFPGKESGNGSEGTGTANTGGSRSKRRGAVGDGSAEPVGNAAVGDGWAPGGAELPSPGAGDVASVGSCGAGLGCGVPLADGAVACEGLPGVACSALGAAEDESD